MFARIAVRDAVNRAREDGKPAHRATQDDAGHHVVLQVRLLAEEQPAIPRGDDDVLNERRPEVEVTRLHRALLRLRCLDAVHDQRLSLGDAFLGDLPRFACFERFRHV